MTREWLLELHDGVYCEKVQREQKGSLVDYYRKTLCAGFVKLLVSGDPEGIKVVLTDKGVGKKGDWVQVKVTKVGFYRWWWEFVDGYYKSINNMYGMYRVCEDILMGIFPNDFDERDEDGKWKEVVFMQEGGVEVETHDLWIQITPL
jgi:hypothetical protein